MFVLVSSPVNAQSSINCGFAPFKPLGCPNGYWQCVCDANGNCQWVIVGCN